LILDIVWVQMCGLAADVYTTQRIPFFRGDHRIFETMSPSAVRWGQQSLLHNLWSATRAAVSRAARKKFGLLRARNTVSDRTELLIAPITHS